MHVALAPREVLVVLADPGDLDAAHGDEGRRRGGGRDGAVGIGRRPAEGEVRERVRLVVAEDVVVDRYRQRLGVPEVDPRAVALDDVRVEVHLRGRAVLRVGRPPTARARIVRDPVHLGMGVTVGVQARLPGEPRPRRPRDGHVVDRVSGEVGKRHLVIHDPIGADARVGARQVHPLLLAVPTHLRRPLACGGRD